MLPLQDGVIDQLKFIHELIDANKSIVEYETMLKNSKLHPKFLLRPVMLKEAVQSTKLEGTQVTLDDVMEVEAETKKVNKTRGAS